MNSRVWTVFIAGWICLGWPAWAGAQQAQIAAAESAPTAARADVRRIPLRIESAPSVGFSLVAPSQTGISFVNRLPEHRHLTNQILLNGAGVAAGDVDSDGRVDLYFCASQGANHLFLNRGGWRFEAVANAGGAACTDLTSTGACFADLDGDGHLDLVVNTIGNGTRIFFNDGKGRFRPHTEILNLGAGGMTTALADVDGDGYLDLYIANYRTSGLMDMPNARATFRTVGGRLELDKLDGRSATEPELAHRFMVGPRGEIEELGQPDVFYRNLGGTNFLLEPFGGGRFLDEDGRSVPAPPREWALCAMFYDLTGDGLPELYVCNDFQSPDRLWINRGGGVLQLAPRGTLGHTSRFSMAVDFADLNRDDRIDFFVVDMLSRKHGLRLRSIIDSAPPESVVFDSLGCPQYARNTLFVNRGDGRFAEMAHWAGLEASEWSWSCVFLDVDLDGWEDVLISNGMERAARDADVVARLQALRASRRLSDAEIFEARRMFPRLDTANLAFRNRGNMTFEEVSAAWGFATPGVSHAMALADLDNDGDLDVVINNLNSPAGVYRNQGSNPRIMIRLEGLAPNTRGVGARIRVISPAGVRQSQEIIAGGRYLAGDEPARAFAAFSTQDPVTIEVAWRSGRFSRVESAVGNCLYVIREPEGSIGPGAPAAAGAPPPRLFEDVSARLNHSHTDELFDDFQRQPLLPWKLSDSGPGVAWVDLDNDGDEDLVIGAGKGGRPGVYIGDGQGAFKARTALGNTWTREAGGLAVAPGPDGVPRLLAAVSHYEDGLVLGSVLRRVGVDTEEDLEVQASANGVAGALALADVDADGDLDLFVAGRVIPGRYPQAASSRLFLNDSGRFRAERAIEFGSVGLVQGCVFADIDGDRDSDLVLACEWGPLRLLVNEGGRFVDATRDWGLADWTGLWTGIAAGDFDGDGRLDLAAANWGLNSSYRPTRTHPERIAFGDFNGDGAVELIQIRFDTGLKSEVPIRSLEVLGRALPQLKERFTSHRAFSTATSSAVLGALAPALGAVEAHALASCIFLNRGDRFECRPLPVEAQIAPAFGVCVADANGDGREDLFLAQNFFGQQPEESRLDAGLGLWLLGDGQGGFRALSGAESGVEILGEQRGAAVADFDGDGRVDLAVGVRNGTTRLFLNRAAKPGLRIRLTGPPGNRGAVGAIVRVRCGSAWGPARGIHAGSGFLSQDGETLVFGLPAAPEEVEIRWPNGDAQRLPVRPDQTEIAVRCANH